MNILSDNHRTPTRTKTVELTPEEWARPDSEIVTAADNNGRWDGGCCHFGGRVIRHEDGKTATVHIFID